MKVLKFGGTSVRDAERIRGVVALVREAAASGPVAVVVSALGGVTHQLEEAASASAAGEVPGVDEIQRRHVEALERLAGAEELAPLRTEVESILRGLQDLLQGIRLVRECSPRTRDAVLGAGELLSSLVLAAALRAHGVRAEAVDARELVITDGAHGSARVDIDETYRRIRDRVVGTETVPVVTGFIASTGQGETTTLGRGGSDYTAALIAAAVAAERLEIWTDVDGVMSADPRLVPGAFSLPALRYDEMMELSHFGAKVVYPPAVHPARTQAIPMVIRNTMRPAFDGTLVTEDAAAGGSPIRGISSINDVAMLRVEGDGMVGVPGIAARLFGALAAEGISVILISQASSEHSICFAVDPGAVPSARARLDKEFALERRAGLVDEVIVEEGLSVIAVVGAAMRESPGIAGRIFAVLGNHGVNVRAIAQGSSELNISFVVSRRDETTALRTIHHAFFGDAGRTAVYLVGLGRVGSAFARQIGEQASRDPRAPYIAGTCTTRTMRVGDSEAPADVEDFVSRVVEHGGDAVLVDCTASDALPAHYRSVLDAGGSVVTANKRSVAGAQADFDRLGRARGFFGFETTVGAGLPVISTLTQLVETGDTVRSIEGVFSGTTGFIVSQVRAGVPLSRALRAAHDAGYTEPDPREDLSGSDVLRKLLVLARVAGDAIEADEIAVEPLVQVPAPWGDLDAFWQWLPSVDEAFARRSDEAAASGGSLCYLARWSAGSARVGLHVVPEDHPAARLAGTDNLFVIATSRYTDAPLVIRGPGAGPEVTAAGVFTDVLTASRRRRS